MIFLATTDCNLEEIQLHFNKQLMTPSHTLSATRLELDMKCRQRLFKYTIIIFSAAYTRL